MLLKPTACLALLLTALASPAAEAAMASANYRIEREGVTSGGNYPATSPAYTSHGALLALPAPASGSTSPNYSLAPLTLAKAAADQRNGVLDPANTSGAPKVADALIVMRAVLGDVALTPAQQLHADVAPLKNGKSAPDGKVDLGDVLLILRRVVQLVTW